MENELVTMKELSRWHGISEPHVHRLLGANRVEPCGKKGKANLYPKDPAERAVTTRLQRGKLLAEAERKRASSRADWENEMTIDQAFAAVHGATRHMMYGGGRSCSKVGGRPKPRHAQFNGKRCVVFKKAEILPFLENKVAESKAAKVSRETPKKKPQTPLSNFEKTAEIGYGGKAEGEKLQATKRLYAALDAVKYAGKNYVSERNTAVCA